MQHEFSMWVGIDWATEEHQVCGVDAQSKTLFQHKVSNTGDGIEVFVARLLERVNGDASKLAVSIETPRGAIVESLIERGVAVFCINPKQLDRFRDRHTVGGAKSDALDAFVLADSLRTDQRLYRRIELSEPTRVELREMVRARKAILDAKVAMASRLREQLIRYYPQILKLGSVHDDLWLYLLLDLAPTPKAVKTLPRAKVENLLRKSRIRRISADEVLAILREKPLPVAPGVAEAASAHVKLLLPLIRLIRTQIAECDARILRLLAEVGASRDASGAEPGDDLEPIKQHRDADILLSVPGLGVLTSATMLTEAETALRNRDYQMLRVQSGVAPVSSQTGKQRKPKVSIRRACNGWLRDAIYHWARTSMQRDPMSLAHYRRLRKAGHTHGRALRGIADRLLSMLISMLKSGTLYDPTRRVPVAVGT